MKKYFPIFILTIVISVLLSCNALSRTESTQKAADVTPSATVATPSFTQTPAVQASRPCPIPAGSPVPFYTSGFSELPDDVRQFLNADGDIEILHGILEERGMVPIDSQAWVEDDFTGDGLNDLAIILIDPDVVDLFPQGTLILNQCQEDHYKIVFQSPQIPGWGAPEIIFSNDLNGDHVSDLLVGRQSCGAHTCFTQLEALLWKGERLENRLQGTSEDMPGPTIEVDPESKEITVIAEGIGSVGAGPYRRFYRQWAWDEDQDSFLPSADISLPSPYRIHALHDADQAAENGDYGEAVDLYTRVIEGDELQDFMDPEIERPQLAAYASFRLMLTYLLMNDIDEAEAVYASIMTNYLADSATSDFALLSDAFWMEYQSSDDVGSACLAAISFADTHQETILDALYYGYANPSYEAADICPFID